MQMSSITVYITLHEHTISKFIYVQMYCHLLILFIFRTYISSYNICKWCQKSNVGVNIKRYLTISLTGAGGNTFVSKPSHAQSTTGINLNLS